MRAAVSIAAAAALVLAAMSSSAAAAASAGASAAWCIAVSSASDAAMQKGLDFACGGGADCAPIQQSGLCYLPNTLASHASYAYNSYYQRSSHATTACDFAGTATISVSDPTYGSCTYPSSPSTAGGAPTGTTPMPGTTAPPILGASNSSTSLPSPSSQFGGFIPGGSGGGVGSGGIGGNFSPPLPDPDDSAGTVLVATHTSSLVFILANLFWFGRREM